MYVGVPNLKIEGCLAHAHNLVAGGHDGHSRLGMHENALLAKRCQQSHIAVVQALARMQDNFSFAGLASLRIDELTGLESTVRAHAISIALDMLHHHHGVGPARDWRSRHDLHGL
jgi:hypothetical protein